MPSLRFGLIGYGAWGAHHGRAIASASGTALVAIAARSEAGCARAATDHPQARVYADYRDLLDREELDIIDVVLPSDLHYPVARDVLLSGRHLLLEKPMALRLDQCDALLGQARHQGRVLAVGHELRVSSLWGAVKELIDSGVVGEPLHVLIELWRRPYRLGSGGWRYDPRRVGNWILEEPIHFFDLARWYFTRAGEPVSVYAQGNGKQPEQPGLHDNFSALVTFPRGRYAVVTQTLAGWEHHQVAKVTGTEGALWASWAGTMDRTFEPTYRLQVQRGQQVETVPVARPAGEVYELVEEIARVAQAVRGEAPVACTGEDGRWSVALCLGAQASLDSGQPFRFGER